MDIQFYHLLATTLERALPQLLNKALQAEYRVQISCRDRSTVKMLDARLWDYDPASFLPHGVEEEDHAERQPILLGVSDENKNQAQLRVITDGRTLEMDALNGYQRVLDVFNGNDETATVQARERWKHYKTTDHNLSYIRQMPDGSWKKQA